MLGDALSSADYSRLEVIRAARYAAHADAMASNLWLAGNESRAAIWEAEQAIWQQRQKQAIGTVSLGRQVLIDVAAETTRETYDMNVVTTLK